MKKALAGPAKPAAGKKPKRRAMIATTGRRIGAGAAAVARWERETERKIGKRVGPPSARLWRGARATAARSSARMRTAVRRLGRATGRRLRPAGARLFRALAAIDAGVRRTAAWAVRAATRASAVVTPERAACGVVVAAAACLVVSQFVDYRGVRVGQPGYEGLPDVAAAPTVAIETAGSAHAYLLAPLAIIAACLAVLSLRPGRRRMGRIVFALGLVSIATVLLVDLPAGLDAGAQAARFSGATAILDNGFYAELAASAVLALGGLLLVLNPSGPRKPSLARTQGGRRGARTPVRKQADRPRTPPDEGLQRPATIPRRA